MARYTNEGRVNYCDCLSKKKKMLFTMFESSGDPDPLTFTPTVLLTSESPSSVSTATGLILTDSDISQKVERLNLQNIISADKKGALVAAINEHTLYWSTSYGGTFTEHQPGFVGAQSVLITGEQIIIADDNGIWRADINTLVFDPVIPVVEDYGYLRAEEGRLYMAEKGDDVLRWSDDWGNPRTTSATVPGDPLKTANVRPSKYTSGRVYGWNGIPQISLNYGVQYLEYVNGPSSSDFMDFIELPSGEAYATHGVNVYQIETPGSGGSAWTVVFTASSEVLSIGDLSDRIVINADGGIYETKDKFSTTTFLDVTEFGASSGSIVADDLTYLISESSLNYLTDKSNEDFITKAIPIEQQIGDVVYWFDSQRQSVANSNLRNMTVATDNSAYNIGSTLSNAPNFWVKTDFDPNIIAFSGAEADGIELGSPDHLDNVWDGGGTIAVVCDLFDNKLDEAFYHKNVWIFSVDNPGAGESNFRFDHTATGASYQFEADSLVFQHGQPNIVILSWDKNTPSTLPSIRLNGEDVTVVQDAGSGTARDDSAEPIVFGRNSGSVRNFNGEMFESGIFSKTLTLAQKQQLEASLSDKWGVGSGRKSPAIPVNARNLACWFDPSYRPLLDNQGSVTFLGLDEKSARTQKLFGYSGTCRHPISPKTGRTILSDNGGAIRQASQTETANLWTGGANFAFAGVVTSAPAVFGCYFNKAAWSIRVRTVGDDVIFNFEHLSTGTNYEFEAQDSGVHIGEEFYCIVQWNKSLPNTSLAIWINGVNQVITTITTGTPIMLSDGADQLTVFNNLILTEQLDGDVYEFFYSGVFYTATEITAVNEYFAQKWEIN